MWALAVAHPILDVVGRAPEFFVAHRPKPPDIWLMLAALVVVMPLLLVLAVHLVARVIPRVTGAAAAIAIAALSALLALQAVQRIGIATWPPAVIAALVCGGLAAFGYWRSSVFRQGLAFLSLAVVIVPIVFLLRPGIANLVIRNDRTAPHDAQRPARAVPVVLVVFDDLPLLPLLDAAGEIDTALYPNFAALARDGIWFRNATTVSPFTRWALPALLSGKYPVPEAVPTTADHPDTLFTLLGGTHHLQVTEAVTDLCPPELCHRETIPIARRLRDMASDLVIVYLHLVLTPDLRQHLPSLTGTWARFASVEGGASAGSEGDWHDRWLQRGGDSPRKLDERVGVVREFVEGISAKDTQPAVYFLHSLLSHGPHVFLPSGQRNTTSVQIPEKAGVSDDEWANAQNQQRQLLQIRLIDVWVGRLTARLKSEALYERSLVIVTSDHGSSYYAGHERRAFTPETAPEVMRVPLLIKPPATFDAAGSAQRREGGLYASDRNAEVIDILPTVAHVLGTKPAWQTDGSSLLDPSAPERSRKRFLDGDRVHWYGREGPDMRVALRRMQAMFDGAANPYRLPTPPRFSGLVGRPLGELRVAAEPAGRVQVFHAWSYRDVDPRAERVPFDVVGRLLEPPSLEEPRYIAVAVNGTVGAVTRTWTADPGTWLATPPLNAWRKGQNALELFAIEGPDTNPVLRPLQRSDERLADLNLVLGAVGRIRGVQHHGFYRTEGTLASPLRWTRGHGTVIVPLAGERPKTLRLKVARSRVPRSRFKVSVDGCVLFDGHLDDAEWERSLDLDACPVGTSRATIELVSDAARGPGRDARMLGVAIREIMLQ